MRRSEDENLSLIEADLALVLGVHYPGNSLSTIQLYDEFGVDLDLSLPNFRRLLNKLAETSRFNWFAWRRRGRQRYWWWTGPSISNAKPPLPLHLDKVLDVAAGILSEQPAHRFAPSRLALIGGERIGVSWGTFRAWFKAAIANEIPIWMEVHIDRGHQRFQWRDDER